MLGDFDPTVCRPELQCLGWMAVSRGRVTLWWPGLAGQEATLDHMAPQAILTSP